MCFRELRKSRWGEKRSRSNSPESCGDSSAKMGNQSNSEALDHNVSTFEKFDEALSLRRLPIVLFGQGMREQIVWRGGAVEKGTVIKPDRPPDMIAKDPIAMSPAYLGFTVEPDSPRYLQYEGVGMVFARPCGANFMQPSIDTMLLCQGLSKLFSEGHKFRSAIDIGSGSGFIGKFAGVKAPGDGELSVTLVDIDPAASKFGNSSGFNAPAQGFNGRPLSWKHVSGDAVELLDEIKGFDLIISNPPYIPTKNETQVAVTVSPHGFWEGTGIIVNLIERLARSEWSTEARLVLIVTSLTLKAQSVRTTLQNLRKRGVRFRCLVEQEVAWKAFYAGPVGHSHLLAGDKQREQRERIGEVDFFIGATKPGKPRLQTTFDGRQDCFLFHWHVVYVLDFWREVGERV